MPCALIIGERKASTDQKTSLNEALREHAVSVWEELRSDLAAEDRHGPARQVDVEVLADLDLELAAVELAPYRRVAAAQDVGDGRAARAGAARSVSPTPRSKIRARMVGVVEGGEPRDVGAVGELRVASRSGGRCAPRSRASSVGRVGDVDRRLRVADRQMLEAKAVEPRRRARAYARAHVDAAGRLGEDRRADLARRGLDRELARVGPAGAAQVEDRLARAVAAELGLGAVGVEDPQARDEARLVGRRQHEHAVGADARCGGRTARARARRSARAPSARDASTIT